MYKYIANNVLLLYKYPQNISIFLGDQMGYKQIGENLSFADLAVAKSLEHNRSLKMMEKINGVVEWDNIEAVLTDLSLRLP